MLLNNTIIQSMNLIVNNFSKMRNNVEIVYRVKSYLYYRMLSIVIIRHRCLLERKSNYFVAIQ